ncbi:hypothetical protein Moror_5245 [Moniliophthora roreri MCA 2997]|uniref:Uncharacterized protein n=2 Tax=Moniliophthora roreri TaxID=221103 RepID=V2X9N1_MONRO|nr:hypothetical protein Moror_5245 [Moniliophthora roreri MCA 2997]
MEHLAASLQKALSKKFQEDPSRVPVTHHSDARKVFFDGLSLGKKLERNFNIRNQNESIRESELNHAEDPEQYPLPTQRTSSPIYITDDEVFSLVNSTTVFERNKQWLPDDFIAEVEALRKQKDKESSSARAEGSEKADKQSTKSSISLKKPEVEVVDWVEGVDAPLKFPDELKFAAQFYDMPLGMFTNASLTKIWNLWETFTPKKRAHPQCGQQMVWDIADICTSTLSLPKDDDLEGLDYVGWVEAVVNYLKFVKEVNIDGRAAMNIASWSSTSISSWTSTRPESYLHYGRKKRGC